MEQTLVKNATVEQVSTSIYNGKTNCEICLKLMQVSYVLWLSTMLAMGKYDCKRFYKMFFDQ